METTITDKASRLALWTEAREVLRTIAAQFPEAFQFPIRPLAVTARRDLVALGYDKALVFRVLKLYCGRPDYLAALAAGICRVNLDGSPADLPEAEHIEHAKLRLKALRAQRQQQQEQRRRQEAPVAAPKPVPPKIAKEVKEPKVIVETKPPTALGAALGQALAKRGNPG